MTGGEMTTGRQRKAIIFEKLLADALVESRWWPGFSLPCEATPPPPGNPTIRATPVTSAQTLMEAGET